MYLEKRLLYFLCFVYLTGSTSAGFTLLTYTHATRQARDEAAEKMGAFMEQMM